MAFLDNSGDIILDAVLTDTGRFRLAKGDGSFKIVKFALGDDEINYALYDKSNASGSAYYDLEILQTPILEAFTNNTATMNSKLLSIPRTNLLYLPIMKINNLERGVVQDHMTNANNRGYIVCVTDNTFLAAGSSYDGTTQYAGTVTNGFWNGESRTANGGNFIRIDQGIDNTALSWKFALDSDLKESQYIVEIDSRLGTIINTAANARQTVSFIDDDNVASYYFSTTDNTLVKFIPQITGGAYLEAPSTQASLPTGLVIKGPQGTSLWFAIESSTELRTSNYLFETIGSDLPTGALWGFDPAYTYKYIDTNIKVTGATTGYHLSLPVRFVKRTS